MNLEFEAYVGELRELRERELQYARLAALVENLAEHRLQDSSDLSIEDVNAITALTRAVSTPAVENWLDKLRQEGKIDMKRYPTGIAARTSGKLQRDGEDDDES